MKSTAGMSQVSTPATKTVRISHSPTRCKSPVTDLLRPIDPSATTRQYAAPVEHPFSYRSSRVVRPGTYFGDQDPGALRGDGDSRYTSFPIGERLLLRNLRPNVLLIGEAETIQPALAELVAELEAPVCYWTPGAPLPSREHSVVVIRDVGRIRMSLQDAWWSWLNQDDTRYHSQIIATSSVAVFRLVQSGLFRSDLYYRLNTVLLDVRGDADPMS